MMTDKILVKDRQTGNRIYVDEEHFNQNLVRKGRYLPEDEPKDVAETDESDDEPESTSDDVSTGRKRRSKTTSGTRGGER